MEGRAIGKGICDFGKRPAPWHGHGYSRIFTSHTSLLNVSNHSQPGGISKSRAGASPRGRLRRPAAGRSCIKEPRFH